MEFLLLIVGLVAGTAIGALATVVLRRGRAGDMDALARDLADARAANAAATASIAELRSQVETYRAAADAEKVRAQQESKVLEALAPVRESLQTMQSKVSDLEAQRSRQHGELAQQLKSATESEERLRATAESLASALRNNATRGVWGETQLRAVVEAAGLLPRVNFDLQSSIVTDAGGGRPDMIVHLPGGKSIAVDAKVPFNSYIEASAIPATATDAELARRESLMKQHVDAVRAHVTALGRKRYWDGLDSSPEMVIAFIPSESLLASALEADPSILDFAFSKRVALASPVTLFSVLKTVAVSWQHDVVTQEAKQLFDLSRELYGRLATMANHVDKLGRSIERSVRDYNTFVGSLERTVLPSARKLNQLDDSKVLPALAGLDEGTRELSAPELTEVLDAERRVTNAKREQAALDDTRIRRPDVTLVDFDVDIDLEQSHARDSA